MSKLGGDTIRGWTLGFVALTVLGLFWFGVWRDLDDSVLTRVVVLDEAYYQQQAADIVSGRWRPDGPFVMSPLYPYLVAATGAGADLVGDPVRAGAPPHGLRILQALLWLGTAVLLWRLAGRFGAGRFAWVAPALWMLYRPGAVFVTSVLLEIPLAFLVTAALALVAGGREDEPSLRRAFLSGLLVGAAALLRTHAILLLVPMTWVMVWGGGAVTRPTRSWRRALPAVVAAVLVMLPAVMHNSERAGRPVGPCLNGGFNLYIGNGPVANGFYVTPRGYDLSAYPTGANLLASRFGGVIPDEATADRTWLRGVWRGFTRDPARTAGLWAKKVWLHVMGRELSQLSPLETWSRESPWLRLLAVPYGLITAAGLMGLGLVGLRDRRLRPWVLALVLMIAAQSFFFVVTRYRLVLVPLFALLASLAAADLMRRSGRERVIGLAVAVAAGLTVLPWGLGGAMARLEAAGRLNEAIRWERLTDRDPGALTRAASIYDDAIETDPTLPEPYRALARLHRSGHRADRAEAILERGLEEAHPVAGLRLDLIRLLIEAGRSSEALPHLERRLRRFPRDRETLHNLALALAESGRYARAEETARQLVAVLPDDPQGYIDWGVIVARQGRLDEAATIFRTGLERNPGAPRLQANLERLERMADER